MTCLCGHPAKRHSYKCIECNCSRYVALSPKNPLKTAARVKVDAATRGFTATAFKLLRLYASECPECTSMCARRMVGHLSYETKHLSVAHLAKIFKVDEGELRELVRDMLKKQPAGKAPEVAYKGVEIDYEDTSGFFLRPLYLRDMPAYRTKEIEASCWDGPSEYPRHVEAKVRKIEALIENPDADIKVCTCGVYAYLNPRDLFRDRLFDYHCAMIVLRPWGVVEADDQALRCSNAIIDSIHVSERTLVATARVDCYLREISDTERLGDYLTKMLAREIYQMIADQFDVPVVYHKGGIVGREEMIIEPRPWMHEVIRMMSNVLPNNS